MNRYSLTHLGDGELNCSLKTVVARGRASDADVLAHIAEFDERRLYLPAAYPCMKEYCIRELRFSEDAASKRVYAARAAGVVLQEQIWITPVKLQRPDHRLLNIVCRILSG